MNSFAQQITQVVPFAIRGSITRLVGLTAAVADFPVPLGARVRIRIGRHSTLDAEVIGFRDEETIVMPCGNLTGVRRGDAVELVHSVPGVRVGNALLGRVIDGRGRMLDHLPPAVLPHRVDLHSEHTSPLDRPRIEHRFSTGVRVIDALLTCGQGQRLGIFAGSGVGKSTLLGQMARSSSADINIVTLVGERGREVREFLERDLGPEGLARSVVVVATSDEPALIRLRAAWLGTAIAEYFRDQGKNVLLMMDSVTRFALAQREIGLAAGEPPATRGYPPSVFALLPRLLERSGCTHKGSITAFYTVLVEGDDANEPISDTVRGVLDGHVMLSRRLGEQAHWPAIDVLSSVSRSMSDIVTSEHQTAARKLKRLLAEMRQAEDLISIGAYQQGSNRQVDIGLQLKEIIRGFLTQTPQEQSDLVQSETALMQLVSQIDRLSGTPPQKPMTS